MQNLEIMGYRRENGRVGIRNHVLVLPLDDLSNTAAESVAKIVTGSLAIPHGYGRAQFGRDLDHHFRTMIGTGSHPNVAAVVVIGIEPGWTAKIVDGIAKTGKPVKGFSIERHGDLATIVSASRQAAEYVQWASELKRVECRFSDLHIATKCGESDTTSGLASCPTVGNVMDRIDPLGVTTCFAETSEITGAEDICAARAATPEVAKLFLETWSRYNDFIMREKTDDLSDSQPTKGNIAGGLTTIEEKAFGNLEKIGKRTKFVGVLGPAEEPRGRGLWFMDGPSPGAECLTNQAAGGFVLHLFPTGQGNVIGHPIMPVIKLSANPTTCATMREHIDLDVSPLLQGEMDLERAGDLLLDLMVRTCNGRLTCAEVMGHREFTLTKLHMSA
ncbi:MAG: D-galactarate dehydratase [Betaproteobacteria bacterium]|nr:D-galactarate dehydratase [Betaproteobacteria bacterium]